MLCLYFSIHYHSHFAGKWFLAMLSPIIVFYSFHMGKTSFRFGIYYCKYEKRFRLLDNDRIISHSIFYFSVSSITI